MELHLAIGREFPLKLERSFTWLNGRDQSDFWNRATLGLMEENYQKAGMELHLANGREFTLKLERSFTWLNGKEHSDFWNRASLGLMEENYQTDASISFMEDNYI